MASTGFDVPSALQASFDSLALLETTTDQVLLQGALYNQDVEPDGSLRDVIDIYWTLPGRPGFFISRVGADANWQAQAFYQIGVKQALVRGIYDGLPDKSALPSGPIGPPLPAPGQVVPV